MAAMQLIINVAASDPTGLQTNMNQKFDINSLRVASPCSVGWETMTGNEQVRHCQSCRLNIYNTAEMTKSEIQNLILAHEGRLCIRLYKRSDGTVLTKDCPVGFRAYQKRAVRFAGAAMTALLGLFTVSFGQKSVVDTGARQVNVERKSQDQKTQLIGLVRDSQGAVVPGANLFLYAEKKKKAIKSVSDADGNYLFSDILAGTYRLEVKVPGFKKAVIQNILVQDGNSSVINMELEPAGTTITVGIFAEEPLIDTTSSGVTTVITRKKIESIPH